MGTRADFYIGRGEQAEWLGSVSYDDYPRGVIDDAKTAADAETFRVAVGNFIAGRDDGTTPEMGWPWPWENSQTTDYAYALDDGKVWASRFGGPWFVATADEPDDASGTYQKSAVFPDMRDRKAVAQPGTARSGAMLFRTR
jgi:hypothetical protein